MAELDLMVKQCRLEDFGNALDKTICIINQLIEWGVIEESREGIMKALKEIVKEYPPIDDALRRFAIAVAYKTTDEIKQMERPN